MKKSSFKKIFSSLKMVRFQQKQKKGEERRREPFLNK